MALTDCWSRKTHPFSVHSLHSLNVQEEEEKVVVSGAGVVYRFPFDKWHFTSSAEWEHVRAKRITVELYEQRLKSSYMFTWLEHNFPFMFSP